MKNNLRKLFFLMTAGEKRHLCALLTVSVVAGVMEGAGLGVIFIFLKVITDINNLGGIAILEKVRVTLSGLSDQAFLILCLFGMAIFFIVRQSVIFANVALNNHLRRRVTYRLATELFNGYISEPYANLMKFSSSAIVTNIVANVAAVSAHGIVGLAEIASAGLMLSGIVFLLMQIKPLESLIGLAVTGVLGAVYWFVMRARILQWGRDQNSYDGGCISHCRRGVQRYKNN